MIQHVLFDADGVLQDLPGAWRTTLETHLGERTGEYLAELWQKELPILTGDGDYMPALTEHLLSYGVTTPAEKLYTEVLQKTVRFEESFRLVEACRAKGYGVHLGTNQDSRSAAHMAQVLGYEEIFDLSFYSCELGVAKPRPRFFEMVARRIDTEPGEILFIDDSAANVEGAASVGFQAVQWSIDEGVGVLVEWLKEHGIDLAEG